MKNQHESAITRNLFQKAMVTMLVAELSGALAAVIDGIITGRFLGATALAACGIGNPYFSIACIVSGILMVGSTAMCTRAVGKGDTEETNRVFSLTILLGVVLSVLLALSGLLFSKELAALFGARGASSALRDETAAYLRGVFLGAPGFVLFVILTPVLQLDGDYARPKAASITLTIVDVVGDLANVFVLRWGMYGIGLATTLGHYAALAVMLSHFWGRPSLFKFSPQLIRLDMTPSLMRDGLPRAACMFCRALLPMVLNTLVLKLAGDMGVTAYATMCNSSFVVGTLGWGIGGAVLIMGGMTVGEQDVHGLEVVVKSAVRDILFGVVPLAAAVFLLSPALAGVFIPDEPEARALAVVALRCYAVTLPFLAFNVASTNYFQSISKLKSAYLINIGIEFACTAAMALILHPFLGINGVWMAFPVGQFLLCLVIVLRALLNRDVTRQGLAALMMLPPNFGVSEEDCMERSLNTMEEVVTLSVDVGDFCAAHGIGKKEANRLALCIEEMAGNVIEHGFSDGQPHHLDVRVVVKDGQTVLRLRDDCPLFDLREKVKNWSFDPEHPERNIGIRMVTRAAKDLVYTNTMNTNNLIITIAQ